MIIKRGSTSVRRRIFIADTTSTSGGGLTGLTHASSGLVAWWSAGDMSTATQMTLQSATAGTYTPSGFVAVDNTNLPGWYELGIPDTALDSGNEVVIQLRGATNMAVVNLYVQLTSTDFQDGDGFGLAYLSDIQKKSSLIPGLY